MPTLRQASTTVLVLLLVGGSQARAGVALTTLQRQLDILLQLGPDLFPQQTVDGPASGPFSHTLADSALVNGHRVTVSAEQNSTYSLSGGGIQFSTTTHTSVAGSVPLELSNGSGESDLMAEFNTDVTLRYELHAAFDSQPAFGTTSDATPDARISVLDFGDRGWQPLYYVANWFTSPSLDQSGSLSPGQYQVVITNLINSGGTPTTASASLTFTAIPVSGTSVPMPPAFWTGMTGLLACAAASCVRLLPGPRFPSGILATCVGRFSR